MAEYFITCAWKEVRLGTVLKAIQKGYIKSPNREVVSAVSVALLHKNNCATIVNLLLKEQIGCTDTDTCDVTKKIVEGISFPA